VRTRVWAAASLPPSLSSVLQTPWQVQDYLALGASQSGSPPDVITMLKALAAGGARTAPPAGKSEPRSGGKHGRG